MPANFIVGVGRHEVKYVAGFGPPKRSVASSSPNSHHLSLSQSIPLTLSLGSQTKGKGKMIFR